MVLRLSNEHIISLALRMEKVFTKTGLNAQSIPKGLAKRISFIQALQFLQTQKENFEHLNGNTFFLKDVDEFLALKDSDMAVFQQFFSLGGKLFKQNNEVYAKINDYVFALPFPHGILPLSMVFLDECYDMCEVKDGFVLEAGSFIGETAIYFASKGASKIVTFEPAPSLFNFTKQNIHLNYLENTIKARNEAISDENGIMDFDYLPDAPYSSYLNLENENGINEHSKLKVKVTAFSEILKELEYVDCLKMNCEGAEYKILKQAYEENLFEKIGSIMVQIHGPDKIILNYLKKSSYTIVSKRKAGTNLTDLYAIKN